MAARSLEIGHPPDHILTQLQIPQARLVTSRWLVLSAQELESEYCDYGCVYRWSHSNDVEVERRERGADEVSGRGTILPKSIVCWQVGMLG